MLDPSSVRPEQVTGEMPSSHLPVLTEAQRQFGYVPDVASLLPGDLILTRTLKPDLGTIAIEAAQRLQNSNTAMWTHAAIYATDWRVFEATPKQNVASGNMLSWLPHTRISIRRPASFYDLSPHEAEVAGLRLVMEAALLQHKAKYGLLAAGAIGLRLMDRLRRPTTISKGTEAESIICSGLYAKCYSISTGSQLLTTDMIRSEEPITPGLLAGLNTLRAVDVGWLKLV